MSNLFFSDLDEGVNNAPQKPIWSIDLNDEGNEKEILNWLKGEVEYLQREGEDRLKRQRRNLAIYKGIQYETQDLKDDRRDIGTSRSNSLKKIVCNHAFDLTEQRVSKLIKYRPGVQILPTNDEFEDKVSSKITKSLLDHIWYNEKFEGELSYEVATLNMIFGECFLFPDWSESKGDISPTYKKAKANAAQKGSKIPMIDENGKQKTDKNGNPLWIEKPVRTGDVEYRIPLPSEVFVQNKTRWKEVEYIFEKSIKTVDGLRTKYKDKAHKIKAEDNAEKYSWEKMQLVPMRDECVVWTFWHKRSEFLDSGRKITFTKDAILENVEFPYSHDMLPCVRLTDWDIPGEVHGYSYLDIIKGLLGTYNNVTNLIVRNQILVSHPKWMMPAGAAKLDQLGNDITVVQYKGPTPPQLVQANPTPGEVFQFRSALKEEFQQLAGVFGVSRGEPPPGVKAGVAMQFLSEQESERFNKLVLKWNEFVRQLAQMTIAVCGDMYDSSDERMIRVIGKDQRWMTVFFDVAHLYKSYNIIVQNSSALPQSKAARTQTLLDLNQQFPAQVPPEQVLDMLDMAQSEKFIDVATAAVKTAEAENENILDDEGFSLDPEEFEDHLAHWKVHVRQLQDYSYKYMTPKEAKQRLQDHILATEMFITEKAKLSPQVAQILTTDPAFKLFPIFFTPPPVEELPPAPAEPIPAAAPAQAYPPEQGLPVNPEMAGAEPMIQPEPNLEQQFATEPALPGDTGPVAPTGVI